MSTYCECGHVLSMHVDPEENEETGEMSAGLCFDPDGCECMMFVEVPAEELERGWD
jgi:hypothetical protein